MLQRPPQPLPYYAQGQPAPGSPQALLRKGIWLYFFLLIFEGALRKWVLPGLATPLLIVRDPLALWLLVVAWKYNFLPGNVYVTGMLLLSFVSFITTLLFGHGNLVVALYGVRIIVLHFPLMFVIGSVFTSADVRTLGKVTLWLTIPMAILIALQFYSPQSAWVNRGVGGDMEGAGFNGGALGFFRPPGTFSFTTGTTLFFSFAGCYIFYFWLQPAGVNRLVLVAATAGLLAAIPLSISRGLLFQVLITCLFIVLASLRKPKYLLNMLLAGVGVVLALLLLSNTAFFQTAAEAFATRFTDANDTEGGVQGTVVDRFLGGLLSSITSSSRQPFFGYGVGLGTNAASKLLTGEVTFLLAEGEWGRIIGEMGILIGLAVIFLRIGLVIKIAGASYREILQNDLLPWLLLSFGFLTVLQGQWAQPTSLGFSTLIGGLMIASLRPAPIAGRP